MLRIRTFAPVLVAFAAACGAGAPPLTTAEPAPAGAAAVPGFDTRDYPGEAAMEAWREASPYRWVGYYLEAPCRPNSSWMGRRAELERLGWETAVLYLGEQDWRAVDNPPQGPGNGGARCTAANLSAEKGAADARDAADRAAAEGFAPGTSIYLDVERVDSVSQELRDYVGAWVRGVYDDGRFAPALYAHERNAAALHAHFTDEADRRGAPAPRLWVAAARDFDLTRRPWESGFARATVWQGRFNVRETWGGETLTVDANVASTSSP